MANEKRLIDKSCENCIHSGLPPYEWPCTACTSCFDNSPTKWESQYAPTLDAVEVVRCKECKHRYYNEHTEMYCCEQWADGFDTAVREDEFCSRGERKSDGKE